MIPEDRDLLLSLRRQQVELQQMLEKLNAQLGALEARAGVATPEVVFPPLPIEATLPPVPELPPIPLFSDVSELPPLPEMPPLPTPVPAATQPSFEFQFGRWMIRIGAVLGVVFLALILSLQRVQALLGHAGLLALSAAVSIIVVIVGGRLERKGAASVLFGRTIMAMALAWLYLTAYAAYFYEPLKIISSPLIAGFLLVAWSIYVLLLAERKQSQILAIFSITLAYVSTAINPVGLFTMGANLILAATAVTFLLRNGWATLSIFSLIGTYLALLRRLVVDADGQIVLDTSRTLPFWPHAIYLIGAWLIFTAAVIFTNAASFRGPKRLALLSLNNGALAGLLALTAYIAGYGDSAIGWTLLDAGFVFIITSRFASYAEIDPVDIMGAYAAQGLALVTGGILVVYSGITRGVLLLIEAFLLGVAGAFAGDRILTISTYVASFFATLFLIWEIAVNAHHPWLLGFGGAAVMLINAWNSRSEIRDSPAARSTIVLSTSCYCVMAVGLIGTALATELNDSMLPPALAIATLVLTFSIYQFSIYELPPIAQTLLLAALGLVLFPVETGEELPWWTTTWVAAVTLLLVTWWARQRITRAGAWTLLLTFLYALALADLARETIRPSLDDQGWMIGASLLSFAFLVYGAFTRVWAIAAVGQLFLALSLYHFFSPPNVNIFPWSWEAAAVPIMVVYVTGRASNTWVQLFTEIQEPWRRTMHFVACGYMLVALAAVIRFIFGVVPALDQVAAFLFLGTLVLWSGVRHSSAFGVRCSFALSAFGLWLYLDTFADQAHAMATCLNGLAMFFFLAQARLLRPEGKPVVTLLESWTLIIFAALTSWLFVSAWVWTRLSPADLTLGWALYALFLFLFGLMAREARLRWCGLAVLVAALLRVCLYDFWGLPTGFRVVTFGFLTLILLGIGFMLLRRNAVPGHATNGP